MSGVWKRTEARLAKARKAICARTIADDIDALPLDVRNMLLIYEKRGRVERIPLSNPILWQLSPEGRKRVARANHE